MKVAVAQVKLIFVLGVCVCCVLLLCEVKARKDLFFADVGHDVRPESLVVVQHRASAH